MLIANLRHLALIVVLLPEVPSGVSPVLVEERYNVLTVGARGTLGRHCRPIRV